MRINEIIPALSFLCLLSSVAANAQEIPGKPPANVEQQLEELTAANEDVETEDDGYQQQMHHFLKEPINLNYAAAGLFEQLNIVSPLQIANLLSYRKLLGNLISIYELQAIASWNLDLIRRIRPNITISQKTEVILSLHKRLKKRRMLFISKGKPGS